uniref:hypothetical protein n=1 Tax=Candidatus Limisoma sp. TaxID=3076476 RepID=UPI004027ED2E
MAYLRHASASLRVPGYGRVSSLRDDGRPGDGSQRFYNRTSAVVARATGVTG